MANPLTLQDVSDTRSENVTQPATHPTSRITTSIAFVVLTTLTSVVLAMGSFWLVEGRHYPSRTEVLGMIKTQAPYVEDRNLVLAQVAENTQSNKDLSKAVNELRVVLARFESRVRGDE